MAKEQEYTVELQASNVPGAKRTMFRGGRQFSVKQPELLELTKEEAEVYENDSRFTIEKGDTRGEEESTEETPTSETETPGNTNGAEEDQDSEDDSQGEDSQDSGSTQTEETSGSDEETQEESTDEAQADAVDMASLQKLGREELNAKATEAGIENPEKLENKTKVAEAILAAQ